MKKILHYLLIISFFFFGFNAYAKDSRSEYPNISGQFLFELKSDQILKADKKNLSSNNTYINIEPDLSLNIDKNWSIKTGWRIWPVMPRNSQSPEKTRLILSDDRGFNQDQTALIVEELKIDFKNDDVRLFAGKFNPTFGTMYRKTKRIGVFLTDFTEDYELREKIGLGISALLEDSQISFNNFFNDVTGLSSSAFKNRGRESTNNGLAGNTSTLSSYTVTIEGQKLFGYQDLFYNFGYRSLGVNNNDNNKREIGYTANLEYLYKISSETSLIPTIEYVNIKNFTGKSGRNANYLTAALIGKYSSWTTSIAHISRNTQNNYNNSPNYQDRQLQVSIGYKFTNNLVIDISRSIIKESGSKAAIGGAMLSYLFKF